MHSAAGAKPFFFTRRSESFIQSETSYMANTLKKDSVVFIDEVDGYNSGVNVDKLKEVLRKVGIVGSLG